ncbi:LD-carboxypeptidase [Catenulispora sp. NF23]|uniref:LD-carboxypeptidase n=1 Tax=Catenulispora pinistramenti TaxID=2705254 RepID=A0ABS5KXT2_9ACTN|nr:LD-carboxypeptidase [Catenulispora pinistramenti]MBS2534474.1 LD-carboxypeptidase [Catenulispora pinistramenti]MBS2550872.1 LD-carboxypeptidase [Catenulispora pinistramenti]
MLFETSSAVPAPVPRGARVAVIAPAGPVRPERLEHGCALLRGLDLEPVLGRHLLGPVSGYLAAEDRQRAADLEEAWTDPDIHAVLCAHGGYGSVRMLDLLDWDRMARAAGGRPTRAKPFVGSSDVTALHRAFALRLGVRTHYGPVVAGPILGAPDPCPVTVRSFAGALFSPEEPVELSGGRCVVPGRGEGTTLGGTLSLICSLAGARESGSAAGAVVLLEDVKEGPYRIDRMLTQLVRSGWFAGARAIACGSWEACGPAEEIDAILADRLGGLGVPVVTGLPFGHGPTQSTVPLGAHAVLDAVSGVLRVDPRR